MALHDDEQQEERRGLLKLLEDNEKLQRKIEWLMDFCMFVGCLVVILIVARGC